MTAPRRPERPAPASQASAPGFPAEPDSGSFGVPRDELRSILGGREYWYVPARPQGRRRSQGEAAPSSALSGVSASAASDPAAASYDYQAIKSKLHEQLIMDIEGRGLFEEDDDALRARVEEFAAGVLARKELPLNERERRHLAGDLLEETLGLGPLAPLMADPAVTDILVNGPDKIFIERFGKLERSKARFRDTAHLVRIIQRIVSRVGRRIDEAVPMVDARLPDGSRVNATLPPVSIDGPSLSIRRFGRHRMRRRELVRLGMLSENIETFLDLAVRARRNILISGGTGAGKSTFLGALAESIPSSERIVTVEDAAELMLDQEHVMRLETRPANVEGRGRITTRDLVINSLRMRPDRIIVGEARGGEALDMLQAMNTGHEGSLSTVHANSPRDALARLETMVLMAELDLPSRAIRAQIASALHLVAHVRRYEDGVRRLQSLAEVDGLEEDGSPRLREIFRFRREGRRGRLVGGGFEATGHVPRLCEDMREQGFEAPESLFLAPEGALSEDQEGGAPCLT